MNTVKIVKLQPYPINALIIKAEGAPPLRGQILKLTEVGFLVRVGDEHFFKVGENHAVEFDIPATTITIKAPIKVIKTYDLIAEQASGNLDKTHTIEMHFRKLTENNHKEITAFIKKIGQK